MTDFKWQGKSLSALEDSELLAAIRKTLVILGAMWKEVAHRKMVGLV